MLNAYFPLKFLVIRKPESPLGLWASIVRFLISVPLNSHPSQAHMHCDPGSLYFLLLGFWVEELRGLQGTMLPQALFCMPNTA